MKLINIVLYEGFFTQHLAEFQNVDLTIIESKLIEWGFSVLFIEYSELARQDYKINNNSIYWVGSHQNPVVKAYINDILISRFSQRSNLIPRLDTVIAHENKGIQGMLAAELDLDFIPQNYHCRSTIVENYNAENIVFKALSGAGSIGVELVRSAIGYKYEIYKSKLLEINVLSMKSKLKNIIRILVGRKEQALYLRQQTRFVTQKLIPDLEYDYKVLVFGSKIFVLKRHVNSGDFRASGSGNFEFETSISQQIIDFSLMSRQKLAVPYCSLDLIEYDDGKIGLIEFQTVHFGPYTQLHSCYHFDNELKKKSNASFSLEELLVISFVEFLEL